MSKTAKGRALPTLSGRAASRTLGVSHHQLLKLAALGKIRTVALPGSPIAYVAADVARIKAEATTTL